MVRTLLETKYVHLLENDGWVYASRKPAGSPIKADAVIIVAVHQETKGPVIVSQFRKPLNTIVYEFPAGLIDGDDTIEDTAKRELFEETGLTLDRIIHVIPASTASAGITDECVALVFGECSGIPTNTHNEAGEKIEVHLPDLTDDSFLDGKLADGRLAMMYGCLICANKGF